MILKGFELGSFMVNSYLVGDEETQDGMLVDPGAEAEALKEEIEKAGLNIKLIVLTHGHIDHIGAIAALKEATGAQFAHHTDEGQTIKGRVNTYVMMGRQPPLMPEPDRLLQDGDTIEVGKLRFTVLHTPGHSPGGICILGDGFVFTGDTLFNSSVGRTDMPGGNTAQLLSSIHTKLMVLPDQTVVLPGHGQQTPIGQERQWNPFLRPGAEGLF